jgi:hypothetical protein
MKSHLTTYRVPAACLVGILLAGVTPAIATAATTTTQYHFKGLTAGLFSYSTSGSVGSQVSLSAPRANEELPVAFTLTFSKLTQRPSITSRGTLGKFRLQLHNFKSAVRCNPHRWM